MIGTTGATDTTDMVGADAKPLISIVIPSFNAGHRLSDSVADLFELIAKTVGTRSGQAEVIVVDDGSTDNTSQVLLELSSKHALHLVRQENRGVAAARNAGITAATADIIGMLDVDDRWTSAVFTELLPWVAQPSSDPIVQGEVCDVWDEGVGPAYEAINLGTSLFRREVFDTVGLFNESLRRLEDYDWFVRAFDLRVPKTRVPFTALHYLRRIDGLTGSAPNPDPLFVRVHRDASERRKAGLAPIPQSFPTAKEYFGVPPAERQRRPATQTEHPSGKSTAAPLELAPSGLTRVDDRKIDDSAGVRAFLCVRNESMRLPAAIEHHRNQGVDSFFVIDNGSSDGSVEWLLAQPDVHIWSTTDSFQHAEFGTRWVKTLLETYGRDRWCLVVDADELFVFANDHVESLNDFCVALDDEGADAALSVMVDIYATGELRDAKYRRGDDPLATFRWFDRDVWSTRLERFYENNTHDSFFGGMRQRVFGSPPLPGSNIANSQYYTLNKVPLFKFGESQRFSPGFHWSSGTRMSTSRCALLHWKYTADLLSTVSEEVTRSEHWDGASQYKRYANALASKDSLTLFDSRFSVEYRDSDQLVDLGIIRSIDLATSRLPQVRR